MSAKSNKERRMTDANKNGRRQKLVERRSGDENKRSGDEWKNRELKGQRT